MAIGSIKNFLVSIKTKIVSLSKKIKNTSFGRASIFGTLFATLGVIALIAVRAATPITIDNSLPQVRNLRVYPDDRVATVTWDKPTNADSAGIVGYFLEWGETALGTFPNTKQTTDLAVQLQPMDNGKQYTIRVYAAHGNIVQVETPGSYVPGTTSEARGSGRVSPFQTITTAATSARVDQLRTQMTGFFDDFNTPAGAFNELKWNQATTTCGAPGSLGAFINNQFHAHNQIRSRYSNDPEGGNCDIGQMVTRPRGVFDISGKTDANPGVVVFDVDGVSRPRDVWYLDFIPLTAKPNNTPVDVTTHSSLFDDGPGDPAMLRILQSDGGVKLVYYDLNKQPHTIPQINRCGGNDWSEYESSIANFDNCIATVKAGANLSPLPQLVSSARCRYVETCLKPIPNVRRQWIVHISQQRIKVFIDGVMVIEGLIPADFANNTKWNLQSTIFSYNSGKDDEVHPNTLLFHWDNFGFNGPADRTVTHNYLEGGANGNTPYLGRGTLDNLLPEAPRTTRIPIPDQIGSPSRAKLMFTMMTTGDDNYRWKSSDNVRINGNTYPVPDPTTQMAQPILPDDGTGNKGRPLSMYVDVNPAHLITGSNVVDLNITGRFALAMNVHLELDYTSGTVPSYTQPRAIFGETTLNRFVVPVISAHDSYLFIEQNLDLMQPDGHGHPPAPTLDTTPPTVSLTSPGANSTVTSSPVTLSADASDNSGTVTRVDFIIDGGTSIQSDTTAPFSFSMPVTTAQNGNHTVQARAYDSASLTTATTVRTFTVAIPTAPPVTPPPTTPPSATGTWQRIDPPGVHLNQFGNDQFGFHDIIGTGSTVYVATSYEGLWRTTDGGTNWTKTNTGRNGSALDGGRLLISNINPSRPNTFYVTPLYGGGGVWKTTDGGVNWDQMVPASIYDQTTINYKSIDIDPSNPDHIIVGSLHDWNSGGSPGILESTNGGTTWRMVAPGNQSWGSNSIPRFITSDIWIIGTQGDGFWRTTNRGSTWTRAVGIDTNMSHGGFRPTIVGSVLYVGGHGALFRSTNQGASFVQVGPSGCCGYMSIANDGEKLWIIDSYPNGQPGVLNSPVSYYTSPVNDGVNWTQRTDRTFPNGANGYHYDSANRILYTANWQQGVWKVSTGSGTTPPPAPTDTTPPTVSLTSPTTPPTISSSGSFTATATASDSASGISRVEFLIDGAVRYNSTSSPYTAVISAVGLSASNHTLSVLAVDGAGNPSATTTPISFTVQPVVQPPSGSRFETLPVGSALPSESDCSARIRPTAEIRASINSTYNNRRGSGGNYTYPRVTGNQVGTTDELIQWTACKWGMDEDLLRAQAIQESYWFQNAIGDFSGSGSDCTPVYPIANYPSQYGGDPAHNGQCPESIGLMQVRWTYHKSAFYRSTTESTETLTNNAVFSTAYNLDYYGAVWRDCFDGNMTWLNDYERGEQYRAGDASGCQGVWFAGRWKTSGATQYMSAVQNHLNNRTWTTASFIGAQSVNPVRTPDPGPTQDTTPPTVTMTAPSANQSVSGTVAVSATAQDLGGQIASVSFYLDDSSVAFSTDTTPPYSTTWNSATVSNSNHTISARATDSSNNVSALSSVSVTVSNTVPDTTPPTATVTSPVNGASVSGNVTIRSTASDAVGVQRVELLINGTVVASRTTAPYDFTWNTSTYTNSTHTIRTRAYDASNSIPGLSAPVTVTVNNVVVVPPPTALKPGDTDGDGKVGPADLTAVLRNWKRANATRQQGDLDGDGFVGPGDLMQVLRNWGK
mgnify:CR=1 FL=1